MSEKKTVALPAYQWETILRGLASSGWYGMHAVLTAALAEQGEPTESVPCPDCGKPRPFGLDFMCLDCNGVRYLRENDWHAHHGCGFQEEWKYQWEARDAVDRHLKTCEWSEPHGQPTVAVEAALDAWYSAVDAGDYSVDAMRAALCAAAATTKQGENHV